MLTARCLARQTSLRPILRDARVRTRLTSVIIACAGGQIKHARAFSSTSRALEELRKTPLYDFHIQHGAKMVPFAGYEMPLSYGNVGQVASHNHVRSSAGLFDVSHMVQTIITGPSSTALLTHLTPSSLSSLAPFTSTLSVLLNEKGGIIDDMVITKHTEEKYYIVTNAGRRERDLAWIRERVGEWNGEEGKGRGREVRVEVLDGWGLVALQGPESSTHLQTLTPFPLKQLTFGKSAYVPLAGFNVHVARGGYTGEDGFEISIPPSQTTALTTLLARAPVQLTGLGARDSLRLEAGMCLYGHDLDEETGVVEAGLTWVVGKDRREKWDFIGADFVREHLENGAPRRRVGLIVEGAPAREGAKIFAPSNDEQIGKITSGIPSPTLGKNIAMGYVQTRGGWHKKGTEVEVEVRGRRRRAVVSPMPFVKTGYWRG
ncbi:glycine cleavage system T protein [Rickenella mellea]|uniref:Aminomethyltransferase n=1 Tax=Rickenella mellea TaxID=50990 RepID=A0A4Y7QGM0_9AGAM|nr:glycine cleavage system T protein [Rickenella mellea]